MNSSLFTSMIGLGLNVWMNVAFLVMILLLLIFRPYNIRSSALFYTGVILFVASLILPVIALSSMASNEAAITSPFSQNTKPDDSATAKIAITFGQILFPIAVFLVVLSLVPSEVERLQHKRNEVEDRITSSQNVLAKPFVREGEGPPEPKEVGENSSAGAPRSPPNQ